MGLHNRNPRATLWLCAYSGVTLDTKSSLLQEILAWGDNLRQFDKGGDANIDRARSRVASMYLQEPEEVAGSVLLMVDSDNAWQRGDLAFIAKRALEHNAIVGGIYPKRAFNQGVALRVTDGAEGTYRIGQDALIPCEFVGTGFIAIPRTVLATLAETLPLCRGDRFTPGGFWPFFMPFVIERADGQPEYPTDDQAFCERARTAGFQVLASTWPRLTHEGSYIYRMPDSEVSPPPDRDITFTIGARPVLETVHA